MDLIDVFLKGGYMRVQHYERKHVEPPKRIICYIPTTFLSQNPM